MHTHYCLAQEDREGLQRPKTTSTGAFHTGHGFNNIHGVQASLLGRNRRVYACVYAHTAPPTNGPDPRHCAGADCACAQSQSIQNIDMLPSAGCFRELTKQLLTAIITRLSSFSLVFITSLFTIKLLIIIIIFTSLFHLFTL